MNGIQFNIYEKGALIILLCLVIILVVFFDEKQQNSDPIVISKAENYEFLYFDSIGSKVVDTLDSQEPGLVQSKEITPSPQFEFDPNTLSKDSLIMLGFSEFVATNIIKYRHKGGSFKSMDDLSKIYGMESKLLTELKPYIKFPPQHKPIETADKKENKGRFSSGKSNKVEIVSVDINKANKEEFMQLKGIGEVLSQRIIRFREKLGGFYSVDQLKDVYGLEDSVILFNREYLRIDNMKLEKIRINQLDFKSLLKHPYIDYEMTKSIINYRREHGAFDNYEDLKKIYMLDKVKLENLKPYLDYSQQ